MKVLLRNATILCKKSSYHKTRQDILITDGIISSINPEIKEKADKEIAFPDLHVSPGWIDIFAHFCEPGYEHRETLESGAKSASAGGFTHVFTLPNTSPAVSSKSQVTYIREKSQELPVQILPIASVTKNTEGKVLSEMYEMHAYGAVAFSDGINSLQQEGVLLKALQYLRSVNGVLIQIPDQASLAPSALMHEGIISTRLGLPGKPALAEELAIHRDIELLNYTSSSLHLTGVSTRKGIDLIRKAKSAGSPVTCSVTPYHLYFTDEDLQSYDTNLKVNPPLRTADDVHALREALADGTIDCIASHHLPKHSDDKICEFEYAAAGMITLQNVFGIVNGFLNTEDVVEKMTEVPRSIFNLPPEMPVEGNRACLTLFNPNETFTFERSMIRSLSYNSPFAGREMKGRVYGTIFKNKANLVNE